MFFASVSASRKANWAVGGQGLPVFASITSAQSPSAQRPGWFGTAIGPSTTTAPRLLFPTGRDFTGGLGAVPAAHTSVATGTPLPALTTAPPGTHPPQLRLPTPPSTPPT